MDLTLTLKKAQEGNTDAFAELYDEYADKIFRFISLKVQDKQHAEDILQDTFVKAWSGLGTLDTSDCNFNAWLYKVASNTVNDYFRKRYRSPDISELTDSVVIVASDSPERHTQSTYDTALVQESLQHLPKQYQQILELRFIQDFTIQETAEILGKSNLAIRLLQHRALKQLKNILYHDQEYKKI